MKKILVIDNDYNTREAIKFTLSYLGFHVKTMGYAKGISFYIEKFQPEVILLDYIPHQNSATEIQQIKNNSKTRHIPVIIMSTSNPDLLGKSNSADAFIQKPFETKSLVQLINDCNAVHR